MNTKTNYTDNSWKSFNWLLAALVLALTVPARAETQPAAIPFSAIGARATADYRGDALGITATADGARLRCGFQKLEGHATPEGLWLESSKPGGAGRLRLTATALCRAGLSTLNSQPSTALPATGTVSVQDKLVRFIRPGLTEEYSVSVDGVRQDFVIAAPPAGAGDLRVELALSGARAEAATGGARLKLDGSGRALAYSRLRVEDATGRELRARLEVLSVDRLAVTVADANATYPVRIDPTFSDADWVSLNPGMPGANGLVMAIAVDGSGNVYVGGQFTFLGTVPAAKIAKWNGSAWSALGSGMNSDVLELAVSGTNLYAGGYFTTAGGLPATNIAKWDGNAWSALGSGMNGRVWALAVSGTNLYAGGDFTTAGGVAANYIAKWDGSAWSALGAGIGSSGPYPGISVQALTANGANLYAGGWFNTAGGVIATNVAKWDGSTWSALGSGISGWVFALAVSGTNLYAGGNFTTAGGVTANCIAKWDGSAWSALGSGMNSYVEALAVSGNDLYAGGAFTSAGGVAANGIAEWNGSAWSALGAGVSYTAFALAVSGTNLYVGGYITTAGGVTANGIAEWNGSAWSALGSGINDSVLALVVSGTNLYAGGRFTAAGEVSANYIAKWNGSAWSALGSGMNDSVAALVVSGTNLYAGGDFTMAGGVSANYIAKWDGSAWSALGSGMNGKVYAVAVSGTNLYAGGNFTTAGGVTANCIAKWDGSAWSALGSGMNSYVEALAVSGNDLYAGGAFTSAGGVSASNIAKWNGSSWSALSSGMAGSGSVTTLAVGGRNLYAGGAFTTAGEVPATHIAKWDGSVWSALGAGVSYTAFALVVRGGDLYAGGAFTTAGGVMASNIAKWNGSAWSAVGSGLSGAAALVDALADDGAGHLFVGGYFFLAGTNVSPHIAQANLGSAPPVLLLPQAQTAEAGATVHLAVNAAGNPPPAYQWYLNGTNLLSCTSSNLVVASILFSQSGTYTVVVTNLVGAVTSAPVVVNVIPPVERRPVPGVQLMGEAGGLLNVDYANALSATPNWLPLDTVTLASTSQFCFDVSEPLPPQRYYRAWQTGTPSVMPSLDLHMVPAITLTGSVGGSVRLDYINQFGPIDAWVTLATVTLTNTSQLYFDVSALGQPQRLYRIVPSP